MVIISLALQGFSQQLENGVYVSNTYCQFYWDDGHIVDSGSLTKEDTYIHVTDYGFRIFQGPAQTGETYPSIYMGLDSDGFDIWGTYPDDRIEFRNNTLILLYEFDVEQGYYTKSMEMRNMEYLSDTPNLVYEEWKG